VELWHKHSLQKCLRQVAMTPEEALVNVEMTEARQKMPFELSGGMARRTTLARCLATNAEIILLDEAFISVERRLRRNLMVTIRSHIKRQKTTAVVVSHDFEEAAYLADRVIFLSALPAQILAVKKVNLPVERSSKLFDSEDFLKATMNLVRP